MIGIVLVAHAGMASETKKVVEHVLGAQTQFAAVDIGNSDATEHESERLSHVLCEVDEGKGVLVLVDLCGATPWNLVRQYAGKASLMMVGGFNVPAVIRAAVLRGEDVDLPTLAEACVEAGKQYMCLDTGA